MDLNEENEKKDSKETLDEIQSIENMPEKEIKEEKEVVQENSDKSNEYKVVSKEKKKNISILIFLITILIIILMIFSTGFALFNINNTNIMQGVKIKGIDVSGLSIEQAKEKMEEYFEEQLKKDVLLKLDEFETSISPEQIEAKYYIEEAVNEAYAIGRNGNIFTNNYEIIFTSILEKEINPDFSYNKELLDKIIDDISSKIPNAIKENSYYVENDKLIITKGQSGLIIKEEELSNEIINSINSVDKTCINIPVQNKELDPIDIDKIYEEVHTEPKDAYYTKEPFQIFPHSDGINFDKEQAKEIIKEDKQEYEIQLIITKPAKTTDMIGTEAFPDLLATFSTKYDATNYNRTTNLKLASEKINGTVLMPGEEFSYNKVVGERTIAAGYKEAAIYSGGKVVDGLGGGICQISSTLYDAVVYANLEVTDRTNHRFITSYVGAGKDATVVYGQIDFKFKNTRKYPVKILSSVKNGTAKIDIYGIKEEVEYEVEIISNITQTLPYTTVYEEDNTMEAGKEEVVQKGAAGYKSITYKVLKLNGNTVSKTILSTDTYSAMQRIVKRGTKQINVTPTTKPVTTKPTQNTNTTNNNQSSTVTNTNSVTITIPNNNSSVSKNNVVTNSNVVTNNKNNVVNNNTNSANAVKNKVN